MFVRVGWSKVDLTVLRLLSMYDWGSSSARVTGLCSWPCLFNVFLTSLLVSEAILRTYNDAWFINSLGVVGGGGSLAYPKGSVIQSRDANRWCPVLCHVCISKVPRHPPVSPSSSVQGSLVHICTPEKGWTSASPGSTLCVIVEWPWVRGHSGGRPERTCFFRWFRVEQYAFKFRWQQDGEAPVLGKLNRGGNHFISGECPYTSVKMGLAEECAGAGPRVSSRNNAHSGITLVSEIIRL